MKTIKGKGKENITMTEKDSVELGEINTERKPTKAPHINSKEKTIWTSREIARIRYNKWKGLIEFSTNKLRKEAEDFDNKQWLPADKSVLISDVEKMIDKLAQVMTHSQNKST